MKYVIVETKMALPLPLVFDDQLTHRDVVAGLDGVEVLSAGYVHKVKGKWKAYGESESLKIKSRPYIDSRVLHSFLTRGQSALESYNLEMLDKLKELQ